MEALVSPGKLGLRDQTVVYGMTETSPVTFGCGEWRRMTPKLARCDEGTDRNLLPAFSVRLHRC